MDQRSTIFHAILTFLLTAIKGQLKYNSNSHYINIFSSKIEAKEITMTNQNNAFSKLKPAGRVPQATESDSTPDSIRRKLIEAEKRNPNAAKIRERMGLPSLEELEK